MNFDFFDARTIYLFIHLIGIVLGAGGAFLTDAMFFSSLQDKKITESELNFLRLGSKMIWTGLALLLMSGFALFFLDPDRYLSSDRFLAKATIVGVIILNGLVLHAVHFPRLCRHVGQYLPSSRDFMKKSAFMFLSGVVSAVSWSTVLVLESFKNIPYSYPQILLGYLAVLILGSFAAIWLEKRILAVKK